MSQRQTVLIVDDDPAIGRLLDVRLRGLAVRTRFAQSGAEALERLRHETVDLVLLDVGLPDGCGFEICRRIKNDPEVSGGREIPVIFLTAADATEQMVRGFEVGGQDYVTKPFNGVELRARVSAALRTQRLVDQRRLAMLQLRRSEQRFRNLVETTSDVVWETDEHGQCTYISPRVQELLGYKPGDLRGRSFFEVMSLASTSQDENREEPAGMIETLEPLFLRHHPFEAVRHLGRTRAGRTIIFESSGVPYFDRGGRFLGYRGISRDITERTEAEQRIRRSHEFLQSAIEALPEHIAIVDTSGTVIHVNEAWRRLEQMQPGGHAADDGPASVSGDRDWFPFTGVGDGSTFKAEIEDVLAGRRAQFVDEYACEDNGCTLWFRIQVTQFDCGDARYAIISHENITNRRRMELERQRLLEDLGERVKELTVLHNAARILYREEENVQRVLIRLASMLPSGWRWPEMTTARIVFDGMEAVSRGHRTSAWRQTARFRTNSGTPGMIEVCYHGSWGKDDDSLGADAEVASARDPEGCGTPFLPEERRLIDMLVEMLRSWLNRLEAKFALRESESRYRVLAEHASDMLSKHDAAGNFFYASAACKRLLGYQAEDLIGRTVFEMVHPDDLGSVKDAYKHVLECAESSLVTYRARRRDGMYIWVETTITTVPGDEEACLAVSRDVTTRKLTEDALRLSESQLREQQEIMRNILEHIPYSVFWKDRGGRYLGCNQEFAHQMGLEDADEVIGRNDLELCADGQQAATNHERDKRVMAANQPMLHAEEFLMQPDGSSAIVLASRVPLHDGQGNVDGVLGIYTDITERKRAEDALRASEAKLNAMTSQLPAILWTTGPNLDLTSLHGAGLSAYDRDPSTMLGRPFDEIETICEEHRPVIRDAHHRALRGESVEYEYEDDGRCYESRVEPLHDAGGRVAGCLGIALDVTERRQNEEAQREREHLRAAVEAMEQVLGVIGHELRTPLTGLRVMSEYLITESLEAEREPSQFLISINEEVIRLAHMVNNLLEAARINSGTARWNWGTVHLQSACQRAVDIVRPLQQEQDVQILTDICRPDVTMNGDADAIHRLILNLITNAQKHTAAGTIHIGIDESHQVDGRWIIFTVRDTGEGIPEEMLSRLGEPFALNSGVVGASHVTGSGLGLAICKGIAAAHGGVIGIVSQRGQGTTVTVRMRADLPSPAQPNEEPEIFREEAA